MDETPLCQIAKKFHTDKFDPENPLSHLYTPAYHRLLADRRSQVRKVLEIGLGWPGLMHRDYPAGGSLRMWSEYFSDANIFGLDIREDALVNDDGIKSFRCDQSSYWSLREAQSFVGDGFDLIVDDGSHVPEHQVLTARLFVPSLAKDGLYVIEDVHSVELPWIVRNLPFEHEILEIENDKLPDDRLIIIRAGAKRARPSRVLINVATEGSEEFYQVGQNRLAETMSRIDPRTELRLYNRLPEHWPSHQRKPYCFKACAFADLVDQFDLLLWCDSSIYPIAKMEPVWQQIEANGYLLVQGGGSNYNWTADSAYPDLFPNEPIEKARDINRRITPIVGGIIGINSKSDVGRRFLDEYCRLARQTNCFVGPWANENCPRRPNYGIGGRYTTAPCGPQDVLGHRHDQTAASVLAWRFDMKLAEYPAPYAYTTAGPGTILLHDGPGLVEWRAIHTKQEVPAKKGQCCSKCGSEALGIAGGMRVCNQCGNSWMIR
jgi:hypothetical protein